jgi:hypothetical protein
MRRGFCLFLAICSLFAIGAPASADTVTAGSYVVLSDSYGTTGGGEFNGQIVGTTSAVDFVSFCLETNEYFTPGQSLLVSSISNAATMGGVAGGSFNPATGRYEDPLRAATEWLFTQFALGTLSGYAFGSTGSDRVNSANALQTALWYLENEVSSVSGQALTWVNAALAAESGGWLDLGDNVVVLNLLRRDSSGNYTVKAQDQLIYQSVPEPGTTGLLLLGLGAVQVYRRRRQAI